MVSVPIVAPYMWYWNAMVETTMPEDVHALPSYARVKRSL